MSTLEILLYNKVELDDGSQGVVRYMGNIMGKKGVFYGIDITKGEAKNDGTFKKVKYFDTKKGTKTGRFCKENKIVKCKKTTFSKFPFEMGEVVMCKKTKCKGTVKYIGVPSWVKGGKVYYGLELTKKKGTCDGTTNGIQYFESKKNFGIYVPAKEVTKVKKKKKKGDDEKKEEDDVREHIKGYYRSKSGNKLLPDSITTAKNKKGKKKKKEKKTLNKQPPTEPSYLKKRGSLEAQPPTPQPPKMGQKPRPSVDYMDEEKDGIDLVQYTAKTEQMDYENQERQRREQIEKLKQMEREDKLRRQQEEKQKLKEKEERQRKQQELRDKKNEEKQQQLSQKERQLKDKEKLEKYRKAIQDREDAEKEQQKEAAQLEATRKKNEMLKKQQLAEKQAKEEAARKEREEQRQLAEKLRKEKENKLKIQQEEAERLRKEKESKMKQEEEEKKSQSVISNGASGSIKDRMAMFQKKSSNTTATKPITPVKYGTNKQSVAAPKSNPRGVVAAVGSDKAINFEMKNSFGKPLNQIATTKVAGYKGEIPLVLYLLGQKLVKLDKFGTFKIFHPEEMEKQKEKPEMQIAHNIFTFFADLPAPLLSTVAQSVLDKAINKDVMKDVVDLISEPYASTLCYLWDILAKVAMNPNARMGQQSLGKVFGPMCTMLTQQDIKGNRVSMNALAASRMMAFFRRGVEWRMEVQGYDFEESDDSDD